MITAGSGGHMRAPSASTATGRHIATVIGPGVRLTVGRGLVTSRGAGRRITTVVGFTTTITGRGARAASFTKSEVGGARRWSRLSSTSRLVITCAGIRWTITSEIRIRDAIATTIVTGIRVMVDQTEDRTTADRMMEDRTVTRRGVV